MVMDTIVSIYGLSNFLDRGIESQWGYPARNAMALTESYRRYLHDVKATINQIVKIYHLGTSKFV
jgi:hypothetical protein